MNDSNRTEPENGLKNESNKPSNPTIPALEAPENIAKNMNRDDPTSTPGWERSTLEKLAFASLNEQKATRRWKTFV